MGKLSAPTWLQYENDTQSVGLQRLQKMQLDILDAFSTHCSKHGLEYFLVAGSALGAQRHGGMIPWDDDIDVAMLRPAYDRFLESVVADPIEGLFIQTYATEPEMFTYSAKLRKNNTVFHEAAIEELDIHSGIFIDIFCYDRAYTSRWQRRLQRLFLSPLHILNSSATRNVCDAAPHPIVRMVRYSAYYLRPVLPIRLIRWLQDRIMRGPNTPAGPNDLVGCFDIYGHQKHEKTLAPVSRFLPAVETKFDHLTQPAPRDVNAYLAQTFGDYMRFPQPEARKQAHAQAVQFEKEENDDPQT